MLALTTTQDHALRRKGAQAVYRALRVQITRFEQAFVQLHGRPPKGAIEKAPLATTYAQYREWKRVLRADAARRIQALFRGARTRMAILRKSHIHYPQLSRIVEARARLKTTSNPLISSRDEIRAPAELVGDHRYEKEETALFYIHERDAPSTDSSEGSIEPPSANPPTPDMLFGDEMALLSLKELKARKRALKEELKQYDLRFTIEHGRLPNKSEKEPIRYLYDRYNALKDLILDRTLLLEVPHQ